MRAALATLLLAATPALAFESVCFQYADESKETSSLDVPSRKPCAPAGGPNTARHRWVGPNDEHRAIFEQSRIAAGLPASVSATFALNVFTSDATVAVGAQQVGTLTPAPFAQAKREVVRSLAIGELAQLPDFSYSLWDWATGNETCPLGTGDASLCHDFASHMGPVNSNHFLPQAQDFYRHYHQLALARADGCKAMTDALGTQAPRFLTFAQQCELEALGLEAIGQHYLQDAWSSGHMWMRWGSPELSDFPGTGDEPRDRAVLIALISGMIHGSRGVLQQLPGWTSFDVNDALCAPQPAVQFVSGGALHQGLGDDYLAQLPAAGDSGPFGEQATSLLSCAASGLSEVYLRAGQQHGAPGTPAAGLRSVTVDSDACFGQRVTNLALATGAALQLKVVGQQVTVPMDSRFISWMVPQVAHASGEVPVAPKLRNEFRFSLMRSMAKLALLAKDSPNGTEAANGALGPLLAVAPNDAFRGRSPPASYLDPQLPWPGPSSRPAAEAQEATALALLFHRAHAADWCAQTSSTSLAVLRVHAADSSLDAAGKAAACDACAEVTARHLRLGTGPASYDTAREPLCTLLDSSAAVLYQQPPTPGDVAGAARAACACP